MPPTCTYPGQSCVREGGRGEGVKLSHKTSYRCLVSQVKERHMGCDLQTLMNGAGGTYLNIPWFIHAALRAMSYYDKHTSRRALAPHATRHKQCHRDTRHRRACTLIRPYGLARISRMEMQRRCVSQSAGLLCQY